MSIFKEANYQSSYSKNQITTLEREIQTYKTRITELTSKEQLSQSSVVKITEL
jgi:hypothetical protein